MMSRVYCSDEITWSDRAIHIFISKSDLRNDAVATAISSVQIENYSELMSNIN